MRPRFPMLVLVLGLVLAASLTVPGLAAAHVRVADVATPSTGDLASPRLADAPGVSIAPAAPAPPPLWPLAAGVALAGIALAIGASRRTIRVALVVLLAVFAVETGVHSVHHLVDRQATHCVVSLASAHVQGASAVTPASAPWVPTPVGIVAVAEPVRPGASPLRPDEGRAPPA